MSRPVCWSTDALTDLADQISYIALDKTALAVGDMPTGRSGRVTGTYEKSVPALPYILAYAIMQAGGAETVAIVRVIHTARDWSAETWRY